MAVSEGVPERLARVEEKVDALGKRMDQSEGDRSKMHQTLEEIRDGITKQRTFVGGILFTVGAIWAVLQVTWDAIQHHFFK